MTLPITRTINETSFAVAYMDATALVLDGISLIGEKRAEKFKFAKLRLATAMEYADTLEEVNLGFALETHIVKEEKAGRGV